MIYLGGTPAEAWTFCRALINIRLIKIDATNMQQDGKWQQEFTHNDQLEQQKMQLNDSPKALLMEKYCRRILMIQLGQLCILPTWKPKALMTIMAGETLSPLAPCLTLSFRMANSIKFSGVYNGHKQVFQERVGKTPPNFGEHSATQA